MEGLNIDAINSLIASLSSFFFVAGLYVIVRMICLVLGGKK